MATGLGGGRRRNAKSRLSERPQPFYRGFKLCRMDAAPLPVSVAEERLAGGIANIAWGLRSIETWNYSLNSAMSDRQSCSAGGSRGWGLLRSYQ
jgi:hypothetical protein